MKIALYPGSFDPIHIGHMDIIKKSLLIFDKLIVLRCRNPDKDDHDNMLDFFSVMQSFADFDKESIKRIKIDEWPGLLYEYIKAFDICCIIRGIRNTTDFENEKTQQYWYEDIGINIPIFYIISDRNLTHISTSSIRSFNKSLGAYDASHKNCSRTV